MLALCDDFYRDLSGIRHSWRLRITLQPFSDECSQGRVGYMKPDIQALINKAKDSLGAAKSLARDGYYDFAASRAYYAMFYIAEAMLMQLEHSYNKHSAVISAFGR